MSEVWLDTFLGSKIATSVTINGLLVPANAISKVLGSYCEPALFYTHSIDPYNLSKSGSIFKAKSKDRFFAFISNHQRGSGETYYNHEQFCIYNELSRSLITSNAAVSANSEFLDDYDCVLYDFTESVHSRKLPENGWFDLGESWQNDKISDPSYLCAIGYPSFRNTINYDSMEYARAPNAVWGNISETRMPMRNSFAPRPSIQYDPSGMSGGPVFGLWMDDFTPKVDFYGLLTNASKSCFNYIGVENLRGLLRELFT